MEERFRRFMQGRYGVDQLSIFLTYFALILMLILSLTGNAHYNWISLAIIIYAYYRVLSKRPANRARENQKFLSIVSPMGGFFRKWKRRIFGSKGYKYLICPSCKTELKIPKGKGKVRITCPKCKNKFDAKS